MGNKDIALKIVNAALRNVKEKLYCLTYAVDILIPTETEIEMCGLGTDGRKLYYNSQSIIDIYKMGQGKYIEYSILHILLHGILGHFALAGQYSRKKLCWRVLDVQVEQILDAIGIKNPRVYTVRPSWYETIDMSLYNASLHDKKLAKRVLEIGKQRKVDDHSIWWDRESNLINYLSDKNADGSGFGDGNGDGKSENYSEVVADKWEKAREYLIGKSVEGEDNRSKVLEILKRMGQQDDKSNFGFQPNDEEQYVKAEGKEYSFSEVFSEFMQYTVTSKEQPDYLDRMLYEYGLEMYGDVPLVEPLEEADERKLNNLVIAIDTSGSCTEYVGYFLTQLIGIFKEISVHYSFEHIYLIQCDASIKNVCEFEEIEELGQIEDSMRMYGFGGTDFRPVFRWIENKITNEEQKADCLLYFSDTYGSFPKEEPDYPTFFVTPQKYDLDNKDIPGWVRKTTIDIGENEKLRIY